MAIIVSDANIFIDVDVAVLTLYMFRLPDEFATPDILYQEELSEHHPELPRLGLRIERLGSAVIADVDRMRALYRAPSFNDLLALALAKARHWPLLTGDSDLRQVSDVEDVEVHGTIWLIEQMATARIISVEQARNGFKAMKDNGRRLPWPEADRLIRELADGARK